MVRFTFFAEGGSGRPRPWPRHPVTSVTSSKSTSRTTAVTVMGVNGDTSDDELVAVIREFRAGGDRGNDIDVRMRWRGRAGDQRLGLERQRHRDIGHRRLGVRVAGTHDIWFPVPGPD